MRAPGPAAYVREAGAILRWALEAVFDCAQGVELLECNYSLVTTPPEALAPIQRLPHFDTTDRGRIALLHYLCRPEDGGTAFFRHRETGFETVTAERLAPYRAALDADVARHGPPPPEYASGDTPTFQRIALHDAAFNRALIYRGCTLHSGAIPAPAHLSPNPREGRLTLNTFFQAR